MEYSTLEVKVTASASAAAEDVVVELNGAADILTNEKYVKKVEAESWYQSLINVDGDSRYAANIWYHWGKKIRDTKQLRLHKMKISAETWENKDGGS